MQKQCTREVGSVNPTHPNDRPHDTLSVLSSQICSADSLNIVTYNADRERSSGSAYFRIRSKRLDLSQGRGEARAIIVTNPNRFLIPLALALTSAFITVAYWPHSPHPPPVSAQKPTS